MFFCVYIVKQSRPHSTNMQCACGTWSKPCYDFFQCIFLQIVSTEFLFSISESLNSCSSKSFLVAQMEINSIPSLEIEFFKDVFLSMEAILDSNSNLL